MMPIILFIDTVCPDAHTKPFVSEIGSNDKDTQQAAQQQTHLGYFHPCCSLYIRLVLAGHRGQKGWFKKCFIIVLVHMHGTKSSLKKLINKYLKTIHFNHNIQERPSQKVVLVRVK